MEGRLCSRGNGFDACNDACYQRMEMTWMMMMMMPWHACALAVDAHECVTIVVCSGTKFVPP